MSESYELNCPFCKLEPARIVFGDDLIIALWDGFPVSPGHLLIIPKRHAATWFDANPAEQQAIWKAVERAKEEILKLYQPDGFNIGINIGTAAGQTVPHLHLHVIPRYQGDVEDPRGGVRYVIPQKANYLKQTTVAPTNDRTVIVQHHHTSDFGKIVKVVATSPVQRLPSIGDSALVRGERDPLLPHICYEFEHANTADLSVAFIQRSGVLLLRPYLIDMLQRGGRVRILTGDYLNVTDPTALAELLDLEGNLQMRVFEANAVSFHPKAYLFQQDPHSGTAFVGSSNLTHTALQSGVEWNYRVYKITDQAGFTAVQAAFEELWNHPQTCLITHEWIATYRKRRESAKTIDVTRLAEHTTPTEPPQPNTIQAEALQALQECRNNGQKAGLVVLATGLGKTWLSAFDSARPEFKRILFVAHRDEILQQAIHTYRIIQPDANIGKYTGTEKKQQADILFASIQTLGRIPHLRHFAPDAFDYIVVDEFHHAAAKTYRNLIDYFEPKFLLGLTATPERTDGGDLLSLCGGNLAYRCDLVRGIKEKFLSPFRYYGVPDQVDYTNIPWRSARFDEESLTVAVATQERARNALEMFHKYRATRALGFCCSMRHADFMAEAFREAGLRAVAVHSGPTSAPRALSLEQLAQGQIDIIFAVDMFNEGLDIPSVDTILMLRPTESEIIWLQQFGRGLRKATNKDHVRVIDYIGNHRSFLVKVRSLLEPLCGLLPSDHDLHEALRRANSGELALPTGCEVTYQLEAIDILSKLLRQNRQDAIETWILDYRQQHDTRPRAVELYHARYNPRAVHSDYGSWLEYLTYLHSKEKVYLSEQEVQSIEQYRSWWREVCTTRMTKSFKMLVLLAINHRKAWDRRITWEELTEEFQRLAGRIRGVREDIAIDLNDTKALKRLVRDNPGKAWGGSQFFIADENGLQFALQTNNNNYEIFETLTDELVQWRLAEYFDRPGNE